MRQRIDLLQRIVRRLITDPQDLRVEQGDRTHVQSCDGRTPEDRDLQHILDHVPVNPTDQKKIRAMIPKPQPSSMKAGNSQKLRISYSGIRKAGKSPICMGVTMVPITAEITTGASARSVVTQDNLVGEDHARDWGVEAGCDACRDTAGQNGMAIHTPEMEFLDQHTGQRSAQVHQRAFPANGRAGSD